MYILLFSIAGNWISDAFNLPVPGAILGMVFLFIALKMKWLRLRLIYDVGMFLVANMTIMFLPAGVGIMQHWSVISHFWWQIIVIILVALTVNLLVIGFTVQFVKRRFEGNYRRTK